MSNTKDIDLLRIYFGDPYPITDKITIYQPTIQQIIEYGENEFYAVLFMFIGNTTYRKLFLWEMGIDWNRMSDYELFCNMVRMLPIEKTQIIFGEINFEGFALYETGWEPPPEEERPADAPKPTASDKRRKLFETFEKKYTLYNEEQDIEINAQTYHKIADVLRYTFKIFPKTEYTVGKFTKELLIEEEREKNKKAERENGDKPLSALLPMISACVNHPGFKYKPSELREVHINEFMDSVQRLQVYESTVALMSGMYSGFCDTSKVPKDQFDFMRSL